MDRGWGTLEALLSQGIVTTLLCDDQESKTRFVSKLLALGRPREGLIIYLDFDTAFTVFLEDHGDLPGVEALRVFRPRCDEIDDAIAGICSLNGVRIGTVVFDSVTALYNLQGVGLDSSKVNRRLGLYLTLLRMAVSRSGGWIVFTSMMRARKRREGGAWYRSYAGGRLLRRRSDLIIELRRGGSGRLEVGILKCRDGSLSGERLTLDGEDVEGEG